MNEPENGSDWDAVSESPSEESFRVLASQLDRGDEAAAEEIFARFVPRLVRIAQSRLNGKLRQKIDPEDVVQSALGSFFRYQTQKKCEFANWDSLAGLLVLVTVRKCNRKLSDFTTAARDLRREVRSSDCGTHNDYWEALTRDPTGDEQVAFTELLDRILAPLTDRDRKIVLLRVEGYTVSEISEQVSRTERTVHRVLARIKSLLMDEDVQPR